MKLYAVRNKEGKWLRSKGYGGYGDKWVDDIEKARMYATLKGARINVGWYANNFPDYGIPEIVAFDVVQSGVLNEEGRIAKARELEEARQSTRELRKAKAMLSEAQRRLERAESKAHE